MLKRLHVRQFLAIVECGTFTAAARRLNITQPTLSAGIAELERLVGSALFVRERRAVRLTEAGNRLLGPAHAVEREFRLAEAAVSGSAPARPPIRVGVLASISTQFLSYFTAIYTGERSLALVSGSDADLRRRLADRRIDTALTLLHHGEAAPCFIDEGYAMILPAAHRLADRARIAPEDLAGETMIARRSCEILSETSRFFTSHGVRPHFLFRSHDDDRCLALVRAGAAVTTGPLSLAVPGTRAVALEGYDFRRRIGLVRAGTDAATHEALVNALATASGRASGTERDMEAS